MKKLFLILTVLILLCGSVVVPASAAVTGTDLTVNGTTYHLSLRQLTRETDAIQAIVVGFTPGTEPVAWASAVVGGQKIGAKSLKITDTGAYIFQFATLEVPEQILVYPYGQVNQAVVLWSSSEIAAVGIPKEIVGKWKGTGSPNNGGSSIDLKVEIAEDGTGKYTFDQNGYHESNPIFVTRDGTRFSVNTESSELSSCEGTWALEAGVLVLEITSTFPDGRTYSYTARLSPDIDQKYVEAVQLKKEGKYFSAYEAFLACEAENREELANACVQTWPRNGEIWRSKTARSGNMELTIKVNQEKTKAMYIRVFQGDTPLVGLFVGGTGQATVRLPGGVYTIKDGTGEKWFGIEESFGRYGKYETMTFTNKNSTSVTLKNGHSYVITINVTNADPNADGVGSQSESWDGFSK